MTYSDESESMFTQSISDWAFPESYSGESIALSCAYRNNYMGGIDIANAPYNVYVYAFELDDERTVESFHTPPNVNVQIMAITLIP